MHNWGCYNPHLIRLYAYTGFYTNSTIQRIKRDLAWAETQKPSLVTRYGALLDFAQSNQTSQSTFMKFNANRCDFFEFRKKPLQYWRGRVFQKGVDVQLAVDLVAHSYNKNFDVAVVCSGDVDLLESIKLVKNFGCKVLIASHPETMATTMETEADSFIDLSKLTAQEIDEIAFKIDAETRMVEVEQGRKKPKWFFKNTEKEYFKENYFIEPDFKSKL